MISQKIIIYLQGAKKRKKIEEVKFYQRLLEQVDRDIPNLVYDR